MSPVREEVVNSYAALELESHLGIEAVAEKRTSREAIDITVRHAGVARPVPIRIEAKLGTTPAKRREAAAQARSRLTSQPRSIAFGLCYPSELADLESAREIMEALRTCVLAFAPVRPVGADPTWREGSIADLADSLRNADLSRQAVTDTIEYTVHEVAELLFERGCAAELAAALALPRREKDLRAATLVAALMLSNGALLHHRLRLVPGLDHIRKLEDVLSEAKAEEAPAIMREAWVKILEKDFNPVFAPALAALDALTGEVATQPMQWIMRTTVAVADELASLRFDHAGPLYHRLLASAKYDGSYYTNHISGSLLARLALTNKSTNWFDTNGLTELRIIDPACGTGTLLMAAMHTIRDRHQKAVGATANESDLLHLALVEDVLYGLDVNRHGVHLAACNLTLGNPRVDYRRMNLFTMQHGPQPGGRTSAGSLEFLATARQDWHVTSLAAPLPTTSELEAERAQPGSTISESLTGRFDLVIMNPPFTRNDIRNRQYSKADREKVQDREKAIARFLKDRDVPAYRAIQQTSIESFFAPLADALLKPTGGTLASVVPTTALTGASSRAKRVFLAERFQIETIVTSHDPERINFSENTDINESLVIARRAGNERQSTRFISLAKMPKDTHEALLLADIINEGKLPKSWGTEHSWPWPRVREGDWRAAQFYDAKLAEALHDLEALAGTLLRPAGELCRIEPEGRRIRDAFIKKKKRDSPWTTPILWHHNTEFQMSMNARPDVIAAPKPGRVDYAAGLKKKASRLLIVNRLRTNTVRASACYADTPLLGSAWVAVQPIKPDSRFEQALCAWWNSTPGILTLINHRAKTLDYARFALDSLRRLLVPNPSEVNIGPLVEAFRSTQTEILKPWPEMDNCSNRKVLDEAAARILRINGRTIADWRKRIALEPSVRGTAGAHQTTAPPLVPNDPTGS